MARSIIFVSAILAMVAYVFAAPAIVDANIGYVGTGDVNLQKSANDVVDLKNLKIHDIVQGVKVL